MRLYIDSGHTNARPEGLNAPENADKSDKSVSVVHRPEGLEAMRRQIDNLYERGDVVRAFKARSGDIVDCVPLNSQPGMRAPDMQGHVIMSAPTTAPQDDADRAPQSEALRNLALAKMFELEGIDGEEAARGCPDQTIPIRRLELLTLVVPPRMAHAGGCSLDQYAAREKIIALENAGDLAGAELICGGSPCSTCATRIGYRYADV